MTPSDTVHFIRDRFTWQSYIMLAYYAYLQASLGPLMPFLKKELDLNYTVAGFHFSAFALGMITAGSMADRIAARWGRWRVFWAGGGGMAVSAVAFTLVSTAVVTITCVFMMGFWGSFLLIMIQSALADHHGDKRATALIESNVTASISAGLAPLLIGTFQRHAIGWRAALVLGAFVWGIMVIIFHRVTIPDGRAVTANDDERGNGLPRLFWSYWLVLFLVVSIEWSIGFWGADFLEKNTVLNSTNAATIMSIYFVAIVTSRMLGSRLTRLISIESLLLLSIGLTIAGFWGFWLASSLPLTLGGLFVSGLGVANLFPLTLSIAIGVVGPHQSDTASGRISLGSGLAILIVPQLLGNLADKTGIHAAYGVVALLLLVAFAVTAWTNRMNRRAA